MNSLENSIKDCITKEIEKGIIEKVIAEQLEKCIETSISDMFSWGGDVKKVVEEKVKSVMIPYLESYDYSQYIIKLDSVLTDVLKNSCLENKKLLENFKGLMTSENIPRELKISDIFSEWNKYCEDKVDKDKLDFDYDGAYITTSFDVEEVSETWSSYKTFMVRFECEEDEDLKFEFSIHAWKPTEDSKYTSQYMKTTDLRSLRYLNDFEILIMRLSEGYENIILDSYGDSEEIVVEYEE
ncbi:hypothetical protein [Clostridium ihumii]|uniref:hypothetical protein n=1 Tax=Clostridium ihumii TaxID=1470356 RepID=UPI003D3376E2